MAMLSKEGRITAITLLKSFYDEEAFNLLIKELYDADLDISLAAIRASASLGNEMAIPHLYRLLEHGQPAQQEAAVQTLTAINAPSSIERLVKYFTVLQAPRLRQEILRAVNLIFPGHPRVGEMNRAVLLDPAAGEELSSIALQGLADAGQLELIKPHLLRATPEVLESIFRRLLDASTAEVEHFVRSFEAEAQRFPTSVLGSYLCLVLLKTESPQPAMILDLLRGSAAGASAAFLETLDRYKGRVNNPALVFRILLRLPYAGPRAEAQNAELTARILKGVRNQSPLLLNEMVFTTSAYLENQFGKARQQFLSLQGIKERQSLLAMILARTLEMYAPADLLQEIQHFFKSDDPPPAAPLVRRAREYLDFASEEEKRRFAACGPLFHSPDRKLRLQIAATLSRANPERPTLLRRLNRLIQVIGTLEIRTSSKKVLEILAFARAERIEFLEETCVVTLCQLLNRSAIEAGRAFLASARKESPSLHGYIRGARFLPARIFIHPLLQMLLAPGLPAFSRALIVESLERMDLAGQKDVFPHLVRALQVPEIAADLRDRISAILVRFGDSALFQPLMAVAGGGAEAGIRRAALHTLWQIARRNRSLPVDVLVNRLYLWLEDPAREIRTEALLALLGLEDDYAAQILEDHLQSGDEPVVAELLNGLPQPVPREVMLLLLKLVETAGPAVQEILRRLLPGLCQADYAQEIRQSLIDSLKSEREAAAPAVAEAAERIAPADDLLQHAKLEFKFRRENSQVLTVFFIDIVSYTEKSSLVDTSTLMRLIQTFEGITIPAITGLKGTVIKKMGDGLLATFKHPFNAVLAALQIQERIRAHNEFKLEPERFNVRIGLNTGLVIRKNGDIYGDTVNVAARMETAANPGDILLTRETYEEIKDYVRCIHLGDIQLKGKKEAMTAYSAEELLEDVGRLLGPDIPGQPDIAGQTDTPEPLQESTFSPEFVLPDGLAADPGTAQILRALFQDMTGAVEDIAHDYHEEYVFKKFLQHKWDELIGHWRKGGLSAPDAVVPGIPAPSPGARPLPL